MAKRDALVLRANGEVEVKREWRIDLNDAYRQYGSEATIKAVTERIVLAPDDWKVSERASVTIKPVSCTSCDQLEESCKEAFEWTPVHKAHA